MAENNGILIVDDTPENLRLMVRTLKDKGYNVRAVPSGKLALAAIDMAPPELILLDINMPEMNGYETCNRLKQSADHSDIPVIFISALNDTFDIVKAFQSGGVDYLTKPIRNEELEARIETHLQIQRLQNELSMHNEHLEELVQERTRELGEAHARLNVLDKVKSEFLTMICHEIRTPLNGVLGFGELAFDVQPGTAHAEDLREQYEVVRERMMNLVDDVSLINELEAKRDAYGASSVPFLGIWQQAMADSALKEGPSFLTEILPEAEDVFITCNSHLMVKALSTLIRLAGKLSDTKSSNAASIRRDNGKLCISFDIYTNQLNETICSKFFDLMSDVRSKTTAEGLGLASIAAHRIVALFGGNTYLEPTSGNHSRLVIDLQDDIAHVKSA